MAAASASAVDAEIAAVVAARMHLLGAQIVPVDPAPKWQYVPSIPTSDADRYTRPFATFDALRSWYSGATEQQARRRDARAKRAQKLDVKSADAGSAPAAAALEPEVTPVVSTPTGIGPLCPRECETYVSSYFNFDRNACELDFDAINRVMAEAAAAHAEPTADAICGRILLAFFELEIATADSESNGVCDILSIRDVLGLIAGYAYNGAPPEVWLIATFNPLYGTPMSKALVHADHTIWSLRDVFSALIVDSAPEPYRSEVPFPFRAQLMWVCDGDEDMKHSCDLTGFMPTYSRATGMTGMARCFEASYCGSATQTWRQERRVNPRFGFVIHPIERIGLTRVDNPPPAAVRVFQKLHAEDLKWSLRMQANAQKQTPPPPAPAAVEAPVAAPAGDAPARGVVPAAVPVAAVAEGDHYRDCRSCNAGECVSM